MSDTPDEMPVSELIVKFTFPGSCLFEIYMNGTVYPNQFISAGEYLMEKGRELRSRVEQEQREKMERHMIERPNPGIIVPK